MTTRRFSLYHLLCCKAAIGKLHDDFSEFSLRPMLVMLSFGAAQGNLRICLFPEQSVPCSWTHIKWSPYFYRKWVLGTALCHSLSYALPPFSHLARHVKALWFIRVMPLVPAATEQENKWCTNSGEHKPAPCHNLCPCLLCQTLGKSAWWVKGSVFQGSVTAVWCSINACDMVTYSKSCFLRSGMSSLLKPNYWCILTAVSTSHFDWPSGLFMILLPQVM